MEFWASKKEKEKAKRMQHFIENGSMFLQALIAESNGISNPIRMFSSKQILNAKDQLKYDPNSCGQYYRWRKCVIEDRPYVIREYDLFYAMKKYAEIDTIGERVQWVYNDIVLSSRVSNHNGFLKLIGSCLEGPIPVAVFENTEYGSLNQRGSIGCGDVPLLPWRVRLKIAKEVAIAITYLHTAFPRIIIHRDINPMNVSLDKNWNAKLSGFSFSVTLPEGKTWIKDDRVMGTFGYIDPNYEYTRIVSEYTDVFSFGIFMLVLLMGEPPNIRFKYLFKYMQEGGERVVGGDGSNDMNSGEMIMFLKLALRCCKKKNEDRPKMIMVAKELKLIERSLDCNVLETGSP